MDELSLGLQENIFQNGYGAIAKYVMKDRTLHPIAKVIYSYLCSYSGMGKAAYPGQRLMAADLKYNKDTIAKYLRVLQVKGYIYVRKTKKNGKYSSNEYHIVIDVNQIEKIQRRKGDIDDFECPISPDSVSSDMVASDMTEPATNNNNSNNNRSNISKKNIKKELPKTEAVGDTSRKIQQSRIGKTEYSPGVYLREVEFNKLVEQYGEYNTIRVIKKLSDTKLSKQHDPRYQYTSDYNAIEGWVISALNIKPLSDYDKERMASQKRDEEAERIEELIHQYVEKLAVSERDILQQEAINQLSGLSEYESANGFLKEMLIKAKIFEFVKTRLTDEGLI